MSASSPLNVPATDPATDPDALPGTPPIVPVVLSGGAGTRLWPLSRRDYPKQLLPLAGPTSLLQATVARVAAPGFAAPVLVCAADHRFLIAEQLREAEVSPQAILLEPTARNTAPAIAAAALWLAERAPRTLMLVLPSDHSIADAAAFRLAVGRGRAAAEAGALVTFGVTPTRAETGYGWIAAGAPRADGAHHVARFVEKPPAAVAEAMLAAGGHAWNAGIFLFRADVLLAELDRQRPTMLAACRAALGQASRDLDFVRLDAAAFAGSPAESIDYAVMEHAPDRAVVPVEIGWSDVGSWAALHDLGAKDAAGTVTQGPVVADDARGCYLRAESRLVAVVGIEDLIVVETADAVLVARRDRAQDVKGLVDRLRADGRPEADTHPRVYRPWGWYQEIDAGERFKVKRLMVHPGARLSLQMHHHRAEHWVVVRGTAKVVRDTDDILLRENESLYIPIGAKHRLENPGKLPLHLIEVQSGAYLAEDDIVRFQDDFNRV